MKKNLLNIDWLLLTPVLILIAIGLTTLFSINPAFFRSQLFSVCLALAVFYFFSQFDFTALRFFSIPIYVTALIALGVVLIIGIETKGAVRWIEVFGVSIQFSEIYKPLLSISFASFLSSADNRSMQSFLLALGLLAPILVLIFLQPDLGNALIYGAVTILTLLTFGFPYLWFGLLSLPVVVGAPILWELLHDYQRQRVLTFFNPTSDPKGTSYNVIQAIIAVGSGMIWGKGFSEGTQSGLRFLPERHTDFIFATLSEGLGFIGAALILISFGFLCYRIYRIVTRVESVYGRILGTCAFAFLLIHFFVNIGMNLGILPIVGVTLPFVSFGGSSLLSNFIFLGIISSMSMSIKRRQVLEIH